MDAIFTNRTQIVNIFIGVRASSGFIIFFHAFTFQALRLKTFSKVIVDENLFLHIVKNLTFIQGQN